MVHGHAPAGKTIDLGYASCDAAGGCAKSSPVTATANSHGRYRKDLSPSIDIDGSDLVRASYTNSHDDRFYRDARAPYMTITGPGRMSLSCLPIGTTTVRLLSATGVLRAIRSFHTQRACGTVSGRFRKNGHAVNIHVGDRIKSDFAGDARLVWPPVSVAASGYSYSGRCLPEVDWYLTILVDGSVIGSYAGPTDADGRFSQPLGYQLILPGATVRVACESRRGDRVTASAESLPWRFPRARCGQPDLMSTRHASTREAPVVRARPGAFGPATIHARSASEEARGPERTVVDLADHGLLPTVVVHSVLAGRVGCLRGRELGGLIEREIVRVGAQPVPGT